MIRGKVYRRKKFNRYVLIGIIIAALMFGVIRNIPQFYFLRPQA
jgi:transcription antitermination factor NusG